MDDEARLKKLKFIQRLMDQAMELGLNGYACLDENDDDVIGIVIGDQAFLDMIEFKEKEIMQ